jgi:cellulose biosynthesis protein BcsQ
MLVIFVALLKGGVSRTTTAVALAEVAALSVPTVAIHTDPMGSLRRWAELAAEAGHPLRSQVIGLPVADLGPRAADRRAHRGRYHTDRQPGAALQNTAGKPPSWRVR